MVGSTIGGARGVKLGTRLAALEQAQTLSSARLHCLRRYEGETDEQAVVAYEAENGPTGGDVITRVIISKPGLRPERVPGQV